MSADGQAWLGCTFELLQSRMEHLRQTDIKAFEKLERDPEAKLDELDLSDDVTIGLTPDAEDLFTADGIKQAAEVGARVALAKMARTS